MAGRVAILATPLPLQHGVILVRVRLGSAAATVMSTWTSVRLVHVRMEPPAVNQGVPVQ
jgi:hypothetical protein